MKNFENVIKWEKPQKMGKPREVEKCKRLKKIKNGNKIKNGTKKLKMEKSLKTHHNALRHNGKLFLVFPFREVPSFGVLLLGEDDQRLLADSVHSGLHLDVFGGAGDADHGLVGVHVVLVHDRP